MKRDPGCEATCDMTYEVVRRFHLLHTQARFAFPPREIALLASLADIGHRLCRNGNARALVNELLAESTRRGHRDFPTAMMLRVVLDQLGISWEPVPLSELGLKVPTS